MNKSIMYEQNELPGKLDKELNDGNLLNKKQLSDVDRKVSAEKHFQERRTLFGGKFKEIFAQNGKSDSITGDKYIDIYIGMVVGGLKIVYKNDGTRKVSKYHKPGIYGDPSTENSFDAQKKRAKDEVVKTLTNDGKIISGSNGKRYKDLDIINSYINTLDGYLNRESN